MPENMDKEVVVNRFCETDWGMWFSSPINLASWATLLIAVLLIGFLWYRKRLRLPGRAFRTGGIAIFLSGFALYFIGFFWEGTQHSLLALACRATLSSLEMFVSHSDLIEVDPYWKEHALYMTLFAAVHFLAVVFSAVFVINYFGIRLASWIRLTLLRWNCRKTGELYLFWGVEEAAIDLAEDICRNGADRRTIIFLESPAETEPSAGRLSFSHLFSHFNYRRELLEAVNRLDAMLIRSRYAPAKPPGAGCSLLEKSGLKRLIRKAAKVYLFMLSENENHNILSVLNLKEDACLKAKYENAGGAVNVRMFCQAGRERANAVFESESGDGLEISVVDTACLSILSLKNAHTADGSCCRYLYHPVNYVAVDPLRGIATSPFCSMIVGFGETGQEALRFLFEYGQFPYEESCEKRCNFRCHVVDARMETLKGRFQMKAPALGQEESGIVYHRLDYNSEEFRDCLRKIIGELNYVVIAVGDDERGIALAVDICEYARRFAGSGRFRIFVRSYVRANEQRINKIAADYEDCITVFGASSEIFRKKQVIDDRMLDMARQFYHAYESQDADLSDMSPAELWKKRREKQAKAIAELSACMQSRLREQPADAKQSRKSFFLRRRAIRRKLKRQEGQDFSNALHIYTKLKLAGAFTADADRADEIRRVVALSHAETGTEAQKAEKAKRIAAYFREHPFLENIARGEHKRWNAAHHASGYVTMPPQACTGQATCCEETMQHLCLVAWDDLPSLPVKDDFQKYDRTVVCTSFDLAAGFCPNLKKE